ncbi:hypothetical protein PVAP13_2KG178616 [Panicum virgatum]|uniref:Uncharacterized protein n=1 Tax=Panicum virgatum TaxID=38727 RepID=A0A8T0W668_PANVG|nr:hypothetical protein PVAP13_2KG178616 [Panicum virgatum]
MVKVKCVDVISGIAVSPSRYCITCRMHKSPSFSTRHASSMLKSSLSLGSTVSINNPLCQCSKTQSINVCWSPFEFFVTGLSAQVTSRSMPNANTSVDVDALPERTNSGAR